MRPRVQRRHLEPEEEKLRPGRSADPALGAVLSLGVLVPPDRVLRLRRRRTHRRNLHLEYFKVPIKELFIKSQKCKDLKDHQSCRKKLRIEILNDSEFKLNLK